MAANVSQSGLTEKFKDMDSSAKTPISPPNITNPFQPILTHLEALQHPNDSLIATNVLAPVDVQASLVNGTMAEGSASGSGSVSKGVENRLRDLREAVLSSENGMISIVHPLSRRVRVIAGADFSLI